MKAATAKAGTQKEKRKTHPEISVIQTEIVDTEVSIRSEGKEQQEEKSPESLAREAAVVLAALSMPTKQRGKRKRTSMYFKSRKSTRIKVGKPHPSSKESIVIKDSPTKKKEESPSKISITYERGSPKTSTWKERIKLMDSKAVL